VEVEMMRRLALLAVLAAFGCTNVGPEPATSLPPATSLTLDEALVLDPLAVGGPQGARLTPRFDAVQNAFVVGQERQPGTVQVPDLYMARVDAASGAVWLKRQDAQAGVTLRPVSGLLPSSAATVRAGSLVFPVGADAAVVQTLRHSGLKEDLVLLRPRGDRLLLEWELELEPGLEARQDSEGNVNVYGPDNYLWGNIQVGDDRTADLVEKARQSAKKEQLLYRIPAPVVHQATGAAPARTARFTLDGTRLRLVAQGLQALAYPISIDPTVTVTSTTAFAYPGNFEGGADLGSGLVKRARPTYGVPSWSVNATTLPTPRRGHCSVAYNGKLYVIGGYDASGLLSEVRMATIAGATVGAFGTVTALPGARQDPGCAVYNGYLYVVGGWSGTSLPDVVVAKINSDGTLASSWTTTSALAVGRSRAGVAAHKGFLYVTGGGGAGGTRRQDALYAAIRGDGTLGTWTTSSNQLAYVSEGHTMVAYNGALYALGGFDGSTYHNQVYVSRLGTDGSIGVWTQVASFNGGRYTHASVAQGGYVYVIGGAGSGASPYNDVQLAPINADRTLGPWRATAPYTSAATARQYLGAALHGGYIYVTGGLDWTPTLYGDVIVAQVDGTVNANGGVADWRTNTNTFTTVRYMHATVAAGGYLYVLGGYNTGSAELSDVQYAALNADGSVGTWALTTAMTTKRRGLAAVAADGYIYVTGGHDGSNYLNTGEAAAINSNGTLGTWGTLNLFTTGRHGHASLAYNGRLYLIGGCGSTAPSYYNDIQWVPISGGTTTAAWSQLTNAFTGGRMMFGAAMYNRYIYITGGQTSGSYSDEVLKSLLASDGTPGTFTSAGNVLPSARGYHISTAHHGYLYAVGGYNAGATADALAAPILANGNVGAWTVPSTAMPSGRMGHSAALLNGMLYVTGGNDSGGGYRADARWALLNTNGTVGAWTTTSPFTTARSQHATVAANGYLYVIAGRDASANPFSDVQYAPIRADGTLGTWASAGANFSPSGRFGLAAAASKGYLYVLGGAGSGGTTFAEVFYAPFNANGTVGTWVAGTPLPTARYGLDAAVYNGYLYITGGHDSGGDLDTANYVPLNASTGALGTTWSTDVHFTTGRFYHRNVIHNGVLYVIGGRSGTTRLNDVQYAALSSGGTIGTFATTTALNQGRSTPGVAAYGGYLYVFGGNAGTSYVGDTQVGPIASDGSIGQWNLTRTFATPRAGVGSAAVDGVLYLTGGDASSPAVNNDVQMATLLTPAPRGYYSRVQDFGRVMTSVDSILVNSATGGGPVMLDVRVAGPSGVFGAPSTVPVPLGATLTISNPLVRYLWLGFTLDDASTAVGVPNGTANERDVTDFTVTYTDKCVGVTCTGECVGPCDPASGSCTVLDGTNCDDGNSCTHSDKCATGVCGGTAYSCDDHLSCTTDTCNGLGGCGHTVQAGSCLIGGSCYSSGATNGMCRECQPASSQTDWTYVAGKSCNDGNACTHTDVCTAGGVDDTGCGGTAYSCDDSLACTSDSCDGSGGCSNLLQAGYCLIGGACYATGATNGMCRECQPGVNSGGWTYVSGKACNDGDPCTHTDICTAGGSDDTACHGTSYSCDDSKGCTADTCDGAGGCSHAVQSGYCFIGNACYADGTVSVANPCQRCWASSSPTAWSNVPDDTACDDANACTQRDLCKSGVCTGTNPRVCTELDQCHSAGTCNSATGQCTNPIKDNGTTCNDSKDCTTGDSCQAGVCTPTTNSCTCTGDADCPALNDCYFAGTCNLGTGLCAYSFKPTGTPCDDGDACTSGETCGTGVCGSPTAVVTCTALDDCHEAGTCDRATGECSNPEKPDFTSCDDGRSCTTGDACLAGVCTPTANGCTCATSADCPAVGQCTLPGTCDTSSSTCTNPAKDDGTPCDDNDPCSAEDQCVAGVCVGRSALCQDGGVDAGADGGTPDDGPDGGASDGGADAVADASGDDGAGADAGGQEDGAAGDGAVNQETRSYLSCKCTAGGSSGTPPAGGLLLLGLATVLFGWRRRR
jgi:hypothetical protein